MRLRTAMLLGIVALVATVVVATLFAIQRTVDRGARDALDRSLAQETASIEPIARAVRARAATEARVTASQPRLLALMATDEATVQDQTDEFRRTLDADVVVISNADGHVMGHAAAEGKTEPYLQDATMKAAFDTGAADAIWTAGSKGEEMAHAPPPKPYFVYEIHVERLVQGEQVLGSLVVGRAVDARLAGEVGALLGDRPLVIRQGDDALAWSKLSPDAARAIAAADGDTIAADGTTWRIAHAAWPGSAGQGAIDVVVPADLDAALAPARKLTTLLYVIGGVSLAVALVLAIVLGAALSRPVERLVGFTERIAAGKLDARAEVRGVRELRALAVSMNDMARGLDAARKTLADKQRLEDEMKLASRIQTSILPRTFDIARLEIAAAMEPASEVGGDYYDVIPAPGGAWIGIGDVAGHGLDAGLYALMAQTAIAAAVDARPDGAPRELVAAVNRILFANAWGRLGDPRHMTLSLVRFRDDGRVVFAGAHMDLVVVRADGAIDTFATPGTWVGLIDDVAAVTVDAELALAAGDTLVLYSDGAVEAADAAGAQFGLERLGAAAKAAAGQGPAAVVAGVTKAVAAHRARQDDDVTVMALRYRGPA
jgi:sigma-B regulation protein RsbU (phosphoserine phosphatase)